MSDVITLRLAQRGVVTLPKSLRDSYDLREGDSLTLLDLGGVFVLTPRHLEIDRLADRIRERLVEEGETLESMLQALREERERYEP
jgi:bifunctional DNA-binding transcriptional regulator/antitoxin component of YhaV-PrlF toxin-antitoxin module